MVVRLRSAVLGPDGGQVVGPRVGEHNAYRERHLLMPSAPHHQGNLNLSEYEARWVREFISLF